MTIEHANAKPLSDDKERKVLPSMLRGVSGSCPSCGNGRIFDKGLRVNDECSSCGEELHHHRADDLPAYLNIFVVGHIVVALTVIIMDMKIMGMWALIALACFLAVAIAFALMRPLKGMVVGAQWAMHMHGFGGHDD